MTFPIAVGTGPRHSSSRPFPTISRGHANNGNSVENGHDDGAAGYSQDDIVMAMGTNADETLTATIFICYHFLPTADDANIRGSPTTLNTQRNEHLGGHSNDGSDSIQQQQPMQEENLGTQYNVIAELRVQITPAMAPFVSGMDGMSSRETKSRVPLGIMRKRRDDHNIMIINQKYYHPNASIEFSSNETHLACLIPLPISYELVVPTSGRGNDDNGAAISTMVIFRIKAQRYTSQQHKKQLQKQQGLPKLPDYITEKTDDEMNTKVESENDNMNSLERRDSFGVEEHNSSSIDSSSLRSRRKFMSYVAHEPKIVRALQSLNEATPAANSTKKRGKVLPKTSFLRQLSGGSSVGSSSMQSPSLQCATCMCNVPADRNRGKSSSAFSLLLVGTADGKLLFVDFALAKVRCFAMGSSNTSNPIVHLSQCTPTQWKPFDIYGEEQGSVSKGRIATVTRDGSVSIYTTSFVATPALPKDLSSGPSAMSNLVGNGIAARSTTMNVNPIDGDRIIETKHTQLKMRIELLSTYSASTSCSKATSLRYIHAKWLNPLLLVLLTRSPYLDGNYLQGNTNNAIVMSTEVEVAQIWTVAEILQKKNSNVSKGNRNGWSDSSDSSADIALVSELKVPVGDNLDEFVHDTFSLAQQKPLSNMNAECVRSALAFLECARGMVVFHHRGTDTLAINSQVVTRSSPSYASSNLKVRPFCLVWDWKRNIPGLTFASSKAYHLYNQHDGESEMKGISSLFSWFQLGDDENDGLCAMHVHEQDASGIARHIRKNIFSLSTLSPLNRFAEEGILSLNEPSAILLNRDSVTFPFLGRPSTSQDILLQWEESRVPSTYVATNGPCKIAAIGKESGHSIAVAASRGLCMLDLSRMPWMEHHDGHEKITPCANGQMNPSSVSQSPRWKQFSNVNDEQRFRVVSMDWWERSNCEDLLLATVQFVDSDSLNLVCWSRKSLGFGDDQLLKDLSGQPTMGEADEEAFSHGVALPHGFRVHSMSIIKDSSNRALLLLSFVSHDDGTLLEYVVIQLHAIQSPGSKDELVLARIALHGNIPLQLGQSPDFYSPESVNGVFLAGGSFLFDLNTEMKDQEAFALIGIVTLFQGLVAVCVNQSGLVLYRPSLLDDCVDSQGLISSYWASGMMSSQDGCRMAWNIAKSSGKVFCWSVPCQNAESDPHSSLELNGNHRSAPFLLESHSILGDICNNLGRSSLWLNGSSTSEREMAMGPFGPSECILYAGQRSRKFTSLPESATMKAFHVSNCIVAPPRFTPFLYISFLIISSTSSKHHDLARDHIESTLRRAKSLGSCTSALRVIILKVVEILLDGSKSGNYMFSTDTAADQGGVSEETGHLMQKWAVGKAMLYEIVAVVETLYDKLGFATFFLSVGRQLEPHQFNLIFPLPPKKNSPVSQSLQTAEDLFVGSCEDGSLATALSALPLFSCHEESQESVTKLVYHCLIKIGENFQSCSSFTSLTQAEDETYLHQLYWFGVKLEDAIEMERSMQQCDESFCKIDADCGEQSFDESQSSSDDYSSDDSSQSSASTSTYEESSIEQDPDDFISVSAEGDDSTLETFSSEDTNEISFLTPCRTPRRKPRVGIVKKVVKRLFSSSDRQGEKTGVEEDAIHAAASSFILSGFDDIAIQKLPCTPLPEVQEENNNDADDESRDNVEEDAVVLDSSYTSPVEDVLIPSTVAGAVCLFVENAIANIRSELPSNSGWKSVSAVAHLIQGDRETIAITSAGSSNAKNISRMTTADEIIARATPCNDLRQISDGDQQPFKAIASMLDRLTTDCRKQIHSQALDAVFNLVLLLLLRHDSCNDVKLCRATLISVGIVSGHLSGRVDELLDLSEASCDVNSIYCQYEAHLNA